MTDPTSDEGQITDPVPQSRDMASPHEKRPLEKLADLLTDVHPSEQAAAEADQDVNSSDDTMSEEVPAMIQEALAMQAEVKQQQAAQKGKEQ